MIVETAYGKIEGFDEHGVKVFKGIPYAASPIGELRFMPPVAPIPWQGVKDCSKYGSACPQTKAIGRFLVPEEEKNEDCLYLNVWTPNIDAKKRPVVMWVHGGAFKTGSGSTSCRGDAFADKDIVCVTTNYRLGLFGFLQLDEYFGDKYRQSGNCGILDLVAALKWIRDNIERFGGDPCNITVMGESAGAKLIGGLLTMKTAKGLFHKAILQSGSTQAIRDITTARKVADRIIKDFGLNKETSKELLTMSADKIVELENKVISGLKTIHIYGPVFDGINFAEDDALDIIAKGEATSVPVLLGTNKDEAVLFLNSGLKTLTKEIAAAIFGENAGPALRAYKHFLDSVPESEKEAAHVFMLSDYLYRIADIQMARQYLKHNPDVPIYMYRFDWDNSPLKACHCMELPFVWKVPMGDVLEDLYSLDEIMPLAEKINKVWAAFINTGSPQTLELPEWPRFTLNDPQLMVLDDECYLTELQEPYIEEGFAHQVFKLK